MKQHLCFLLYSIFVLVCTSQVSYEGFKVLRLRLNETKLIPRANEIALDNNVDVWGSNLREGWMDVMVSPQQEQLFDEFGSSVRIEDVQTFLNVHAENQEKTVNAEDFFSSFPTYDQTMTWLKQTAQQYSSVAKTINIGKSYQGYDILGLKLSSGSDNKPAIVLQCTIHAREWITTTTCCWIIDQLLKSDQSLLQKWQWHIIPILNVDGYRYTSTNDRLWRKNRQPNSGSTCIGTDLNRNYGYKWGGQGASAEPCQITYRGSGPLSGVEVSHMTDYLKNLNAAVKVRSFYDIHAYGAMWMSPWGYTTVLPPGYNEMYENMEVSCAAVQSVNGHAYDYGAIAKVIYIASGGSSDWVYGVLNIPDAYAIEAYGQDFVVAPSNIVPIGSEIWAGIEAFAKHIK